jgi:hypothetical protein
MRWLGTILFSLALVSGALWILVTQIEARDVTFQALRALFGFFTSPFILEASVGCIGLLTVLTINEYRRKKDEADEWVTLQVEETEKSE